MATNTETRQPPADQLVLVAGLGAMVFALGPCTIDVSTPALGAIQTGLHTNMAAIKATFTAYLIAGAVCQGILGFVADRFPRRAAMLAGAAVYVLGAVLAIMTPDVGGLLWARVLQSAGACLTLISARATISDALEERRAATAFSIAITGLGVSMIAAPLLGARLLGLFGWRSLFVFMAVAGALCFVMALMVPQARTARRPGLSLGEDALNYLSLLRNPDFMWLAIASGLWFGVAFVCAVSAPFIFTGTFAASPATTGILLAIVAVGPIVGSQLNVQLLRRWSPEFILTTGFTLVIATALLLAAASHFVSSLPLMVAAMFAIMAVGMGLIYSNGLAASLARAPGRAGAASSLQGVLQFLFGAAGSAVSGAFVHNGVGAFAGIIAGFGLLGLIAAMMGGRAKAV